MSNIEKQFRNVSSSLINLDDPNVHGELGLSNFILRKVLADTVVVNFDDIEEGVKKSGDWYVPTNDVKVWRRGKVVMVGSAVSPDDVKVGDLVIFPGSKGIEAGEAYVENPDGTISLYTHLHFLSTNRIFGTVTPAES